MRQAVKLRCHPQDVLQPLHLSVLKPAHGKIFSAVSHATEMRLSYLHVPATTVLTKDRPPDIVLGAYNPRIFLY